MSTFHHTRAARRRLVAASLALGLTTAACGARLDDATYELATTRQAASAGGGQVVAQPGTGGQPVAQPGGGTVAPTAQPTQGTGTSGQPVAQPTTGATAAPSDGGGAAPAPGGGDTGGTGGGDTGGGAQQPTQPADTRSMPAGGNGGATDVGVTADSIKIFQVADDNGAVPGLFKDTKLAVQAYFNYFAASEGTVYGRRIDLTTLDSNLDSNRNRTHYIKVCEEGFAAVGSMSAFDEGVAGPVRDCGVPDLRTAAVSKDALESPTVYTTDAMKPGLLPVTDYYYWAENFPESVKKAGYLYINNDVTTFQVNQNVRGLTKIGYDFIYGPTPIDVTETNYTSFILEMKDLGVDYLTFQGAYQQAVKIAQTAQQQDFNPTIYALQSNLYDPRLIETGGSAIEGAHVAKNEVMIEEIDAYPELQLYAQWLQSVDPEARPTGLGMYAWGSARLFVELIKDIGPNLTRQALLDRLGSLDGYTAGGILPPQNIGEKIPNDCTVIVEVKNGAFVRLFPQQRATFECGRGVVSTD